MGREEPEQNGKLIMLHEDMVQAMVNQFHDMEARAERAESTLRTLMEAGSDALSHMIPDGYSYATTPVAESRLRSAIEQARAVLPVEEVKGV